MLPSRETPPPAPASMLQVAIRGIGLAGAGYIGSQAINFATYLVLARLLDPRDFGLYAAGTLITGIGGLFAESGMLAALITRQDRIDEAISTAFFTLLITGVLLMLGSLALSPLIGLAFGSSRVTAVTAALSAWLLIRALTIVPDAVLQRNFSFLRRVVVDPLGAVGYAAAAIPLSAAGAHVWALVAGAYASILVQLIAAWIASRLRPRRRLASVAMWRELSGFARPLVLGEILRRVTGQVDVFTVGRFAGRAQLGQYRNGMMLAQQPGAAFSAVAAYVILPAFARIAVTPDRLAGAARQAYRVVLAVFVPISVALIPLGVPIAIILLGARWHEAGTVIAGLSGFTLGATLLSISGELLKSAAALRLQLVVNAVWLATTAVMVTTAAVLGSPLDVAIALSASTLGTAGFAMVGGARYLGESPHTFFAGVLGPIAAAIVTGIVLWRFEVATHLDRHSEVAGVLLLLAAAGLGLVVYLATLMAADRPRRTAVRAALTRRVASADR